MPVPSTARSILVPVVSALLRSTDIAPSTTQKPCSTGNRWVIATASASPRPVRRLLRTATERPARKPDVVDVDRSGLGEQPVGGSRSAAAVVPAPWPTPAGRRRRPPPRSLGRSLRWWPRWCGGSAVSRPSATAVSSSGCAEDRDDVLAVAPARHRTQLGQRGFQIRAVGRPIGDPGLPQVPPPSSAAPARRVPACPAVPGRPRRSPGRRATPGPRPRVPARGCLRSARPAGSRRPGSSPAAHTSRRPPRCGLALPSRRSASAADRTVRRVGATLRGGAAAAGTARRERTRPARSAQPNSRSSIGPVGVHAGQHERQQRGPLSCRDRLAEHARERDRHAEQEHQHNREPRVRCHHGAQRDEDRRR